MSAKLVVLRPDGGRMIFTGATHMKVCNGALELVEKTETARTVPLSILWGLFKTTRTIQESKTFSIAVFAQGEWAGCWVESYCAEPKAKPPADPAAG
jgi:hypothetical protein